MQIFNRTMCGILLCAWLSASAAEPAAELPVTAVSPPASPATRSPEPQASPVPVPPEQVELETSTGFDLSSPGICLVISDLVQQACAQYPGDPSCLTP
jgi:hypothetical protein